MAQHSPSGEVLLDAVLQFAVRHEHELLTGKVALRLHSRALEYVASRLRALDELDELQGCAPVEFLRGAFTDLEDYGRLQRLRQTLARVRRLCVLPTVSHLRDPTRVNLLPFHSLQHLELRGCDLSTSAWLGLAQARASLRSLVCVGCLEELRHLLAPAQPLLSLAGPPAATPEAGQSLAQSSSSVSSALRHPAGGEPGQPEWPQLTSLRCRQNSFEDMDGSLQLLPGLQSLDLASNNLTAVRNLQAAARLTELNLSHNAIEALAPLRDCPGRLQRLVLQGNAIRSLHGLAGLTGLTELDLRCNLLASYQQLSSLRGLRQLAALWLEGNPLAYGPFYRLDVLAWLEPGGGLRLDGQPPSGGEATAAALRAAGDIPHAWHILALYIGQKQLLWRPSRIAKPRSATVWRAASVGPSSPVGGPTPDALLTRGGGGRRVPARRIVEFPGDPLAELEGALQRPPSPSPFECREEDASSRASSERGGRPSRPPSRLPQAAQTVYRSLTEQGEGPPVTEPLLPPVQAPRQPSSALGWEDDSEDTSSLATSASSRGGFSLPPTPRASPRRRPPSAAAAVPDGSSPEDSEVLEGEELAGGAPGPEAGPPQAQSREVVA